MGKSGSLPAAAAACRPRTFSAHALLYGRMVLCMCERERRFAI